jgi:FkbM family methyltransferase
MSKLFNATAYCKPELLFRPVQFFRRLLWKGRWRGHTGRVCLPWGLEMDVDARDRIGESITKIGVYDLGTLEVLARLGDPGELCLDIGANEGLMTGLLARAVGRAGKVIAFEPHPAIFGKLREHVGRWTASHQNPSLGAIECRELALSDVEGVLPLCLPEEFAVNRGTAFLGKGNPSAKIAAQVRTRRLEDEIPEGTSVGVMKIDVEGHELEVLKGAGRLIGAGGVRDIVFEEHELYPSPVSDFLEAAGYSVFLIRKGLLRPNLLQANERPRELPNYLATLDVGRALRRMRSFGYRALR